MSILIFISPNYAIILENKQGLLECQAVLHILCTD